MKKIAALFVFVIMCLTLSSCKCIDYKKAVALQEEKDYTGALVLYEQLGDYEDAADRLVECNAMIDAIKSFDEALKVINEKNSELDKAISEASALVQSEEKALDESLRTGLETVISETKAAKVDAPERPDTADEINQTAETLLNVDYTDTLSKLDEHKQALSISIKQYALVNAPSEAYVISCLKTVSGIIDISAATEDNDPNGHLNKAGGYTAAVYFSHRDIDQNSVSGDTIIEKGTACGGQIEVYLTEEDANKRNTYLSSFDGSILSNGSHTVVGTVLIRTSDELPASKQKELETSIIHALTKV